MVGVAVGHEGAVVMEMTEEGTETTVVDMVEVGDMAVSVVVAMEVVVAAADMAAVEA